jgi:hypothetical protein
MTSTSVRWAELRPDDFRARRDACPIVYLPIGLCEPHGHIAALGLDLLKAEYYCEQAAQRFGGVVAPAQGYHIHECGFHIIAAIGEAALGLVKADKPTVSIDSLSYEAMERIWQALYATISNWSSVNPRPNQVTVPVNSRWHAYVHVASTLAASGGANT